MYVKASLIALSSLFDQALAAPSEVKVEERALHNNCSRDNLFRSFIDPQQSDSASAFCSAYIRPTKKTSCLRFGSNTLTAANGKRNLPPTTSYPALRLSSACSCILTKTPSPVTATTTIVTTLTTTKQSTCSVPTPIVKNGDFETGSLAPWTQTYSNNGDARLLTYSDKAPGYGASNYALVAKDDFASSYVELDFEQSLTVCTGAKYNFAASYYLTDPGNQWSKHKRQVGKQVYVQVTVDDARAAWNELSDPAGPPVVWRSFMGAFFATSSAALLKVSFITTDYVGVEWGLDDVVVTPA
ncbi:MAG: hypothetical protein Q9184_002383 [Pyrenodesmia sp. 2 TL-2023]